MSSGFPAGILCSANSIHFCFRRSLYMDFRLFLCVDHHWLVIHFLDVQAASSPFVQKKHLNRFGLDAVIVALILLCCPPFCPLLRFSLPFIIHIVYPFFHRCFPLLTLVGDIFYQAFGIQSHFFCHADFFIPDTAFFLRLVLTICPFLFPPIMRGNLSQDSFPFYLHISQAEPHFHLAYPLYGICRISYSAGG